MALQTANQAVRSLIDEFRRAAEPCGVQGVSVFLPVPWHDEASLHVHVGDHEPVPELATPERARAFAERALTPDGSPWAIRDSASSNGLLMPIPLFANWWTRGWRPTGAAAADASLKRQTDRDPAPPLCGWLGIRLRPEASASGRPVDWSGVLDLSRALASTFVCVHGALTDPLTALPGRQELHGALRGDLHRARTHARPYSLLFINPGGLEEINERHGRRAGDLALREFVDALQSELRRSDILMRYGAGIFALPLQDTSPEGALIVAEKICRRLPERVYLDAAARLTCAVGVVSCEPGELADLEPSALLRRANEAVAAARADGGSRVAVWSADASPWAATAVDPLIEIFTGQTDKDYRNMGLLWNVLQAVSHNAGSEAMARAVVNGLLSQLKASRVALLRCDEKAGLVLLSGVSRESLHGISRAIASEEVERDERHLIDDALSTRQPVEAWLERAHGGSPARQRAFAVALIVDQRVLGALYLSGDPELFKIDPHDLPVLAGVAGQLAVALDREQLAELQRERSAAERRKLQIELRELRAALPDAPLMCTSTPATELMALVRRVAPTDTTVLITGESGTGKELVAHTVHQLSPRRAKPLVIVDCGSMPSTLIESELFGRERGAFTGAERTIGRLAQADGGTVLLDEIGELPLDVQSRLLRFVQEKTLTAVGGTRVQRVDVRILAATNRALEEEVRAGRFRSDLFYRLNVVRLRLPALRERRDDVLPLAQHFVQQLAARHGKPALGFAPDAEALLRRHDWPGNIRELQNLVLQAVVLAEGDLITAHDLRAIGDQSPSWVSPRSIESEPSYVETSGGTAARADAGPVSVDPWQRLRQCLTSHVAEAASARPWIARPMGRWLRHDMVLEAQSAEGGIGARAAQRLGVPETTFARWLKQAQADAATSQRPRSWQSVHAALKAVVAATSRSEHDLTEQAEGVLMEIVVAALKDRATPAAALMGVSVPTFKRRLAAAQAGTECATPA